jgi:hypothetical protein
MAIASQQNSSKKEDLSFKEIFASISSWYRFLISKWIIILLCIVIGSAIGFFYAKYKKPIYIATTTFVLEDDKGSSGLGGLGGLASMAGIDLGGGSGGGIFQGDNLLQLYKSRSMIERALLSPVNGQSGELLIDRYIDFNELRETWKDKPRLSQVSFSKITPEALTKPDRLRDSVMGSIVGDIAANYLSVTRPDKKLSIIQVDVSAKDEVFAKAFNNQIVENVNKFYTQTKTKKSIDNIAILNYKTDSVRSVLNGAISIAARVTDATPNLNPTRQTQKIVPIQRAQFSAESSKAILATLTQNLEMAKMMLLKETPLIEVVDEPILPLAKERLGKLKALVIGGFIAGFLACLYLTFRRFIKKALA